jgi:hypothetical protein
MKEYGVLLFHTTSAAFRAEKLIKKAGFDCKLVPTPREFSSDCGVAARIDWSASVEITELLELDETEIAGVHPIAPDAW